MGLEKLLIRGKLVIWLARRQRGGKQVLMIDVRRMNGIGSVIEIAIYTTNAKPITPIVYSCFTPYTFCVFSLTLGDVKLYYAFGFRRYSPLTIHRSPALLLNRNGGLILFLHNKIYRSTADHQQYGNDLSLGGMKTEN